MKLPSGDVYEDVEILTSDPRRDIAVLRIPGLDLPALELGNSDSVRIWTGVVLIGSPLGLENDELRPGRGARAPGEPVGGGGAAAGVTPRGGQDPDCRLTVTVRSDNEDRMGILRV